VKSIGYEQPALESAVRLAKIATESGARAIVCSPLEISAIRNAIGSAPIIITPGVRPLSMVGTDDQSRTTTPSEAITAGANFVVIGRPITSAWEPTGVEISKRARAIASEILNS